MFEKFVKKNYIYSPFCYSNVGISEILLFERWLLERCFVSLWAWPCLLPFQCLPMVSLNKNFPFRHLRVRTMSLVKSSLVKKILMWDCNRGGRGKRVNGVYAAFDTHNSVVDPSCVRWILRAKGPTDERQKWRRWKNAIISLTRVARLEKGASALGRCTHTGFIVLILALSFSLSLSLSLFFSSSLFTSFIFQFCIAHIIALPITLPTTLTMISSVDKMYTLFFVQSIMIILKSVLIKFKITFFWKSSDFFWILISILILLFLCLIIFVCDIILYFFRNCIMHSL